MDTTDVSFSDLVDAGLLRPRPVADPSAKADPTERPLADGERLVHEAEFLEWACHCGEHHRGMGLHVHGDGEPFGAIIYGWAAPDIATPIARRLIADLIRLGELDEHETADEIEYYQPHSSVQGWCRWVDDGEPRLDFTDRRNLNGTSRGLTKATLVRCG